MFLGNLNQDRYRKMSADYEAEQERLKLEIEVIEDGWTAKMTVWMPLSP